MLRIDRWKVKQQMKRVGIRTFGELADRVGVAPQTVSAWFGARLGFNSESLEALCRVLQCTPNDILTIDADTDTDPNRSAPTAEVMIMA